MEDLLAAAGQGDGSARKAAIAWGRALRAGIDTLAACFDPRLIVIGGGLGAAACMALALCPPESAWFSPQIAPATLGDDAGIVGCAAAALRLASAETTP